MSDTENKNSNSNSDDKNLLILTGNDPFGIMAKTTNDIKRSIFSVVFDNAREEFYAICRDTLDNIAKENKNSRTDVNNIICLTGERGSGKTTLLYSLVNVIRDDKENKHECFVHALRTIEPSSFTGKETVFGNVIASMYTDIIELEQRARDRDHDINIDKLREFHTKCQEIYPVVRITQNHADKLISGEDNDDMEQLEQLAVTVRTCQKFEALADAYLECQKDAKNSNKDGKKSSNEQSLLVISIDDFDMNLKDSYSMMEEVRNFLSVKNTIIIIAAKQEQMVDSVEAYYKNDVHINDDNGDSSAAEMAARYLQKLIPQSRRFAIPQVEADVLNLKAEYVFKHEDDKEAGSFQIHDKFKKMIYEKTGIILVCEDGEPHGMMPLSLRGIHHVFVLLNEMETIFKAGEKNEKKLDAELEKMKNMSEADIKNWQNNLDRLKNWAVESVVTNGTSAEFAHILRDFSEHPDIVINAFLVDSLSDYIKRKDFTFARDAAIQFIRDAGRRANISIGDVMYLLLRLEQYDSGADMRNFSAGVRFFYSIRMLRIISEYAGEGKDRKKLYKKLSVVFNGLVYNPAIKLYSNDKSAILRREIGAFNFYKPDKPKTEEEPVRQRLAAVLPFFVVAVTTSSRRILQSLDTTYLKAKVAHYAVDNGKKPEGYHVYIDWMAFFHNMLNPEECIVRLEMDANSNNYDKNYYDSIADWSYKNLLNVFRFYNADVLFHTIKTMNDKRGVWYDQAAETLPSGGFFDFAENLKQSVSDVMRRSAVSGEELIEKIESEIEKEIKKAIDSCPVLNFWEWIKGVDAETSGIYVNIEDRVKAIAEETKEAAEAAKAAAENAIKDSGEKALLFNNASQNAESLFADVIKALDEAIMKDRQEIVQAAENALKEAKAARETAQKLNNPEVDNAAHDAVKAVETAVEALKTMAKAKNELFATDLAQRIKYIKDITPWLVND